MGSDRQRGVVTNEQRDGALERDQTPISFFVCPSRREVRLYPRPRSQLYFNGRPVGEAGVIDYAANGGEVVQTYAGPGAGATEPTEPSWIYNHTGPTHLISRVGLALIRDGTTNTYWAGEKYLNPAQYTTGDNGADNGSLYQGHDWDNLRWGHAGYVPRQDRLNSQCWQCFGSAHAGNCYFAMCDGSVRAINYSIDAEIHRRLGNRDDGESIDASKL